MSDDEDELTLSSHALAALREFAQEEEQRIAEFNRLSQEAEKREEPIPITVFKEDWQLSQFWCSEETAAVLGHALLEGADENTVIVVASAPSVYAAIKKFPPEQVPTAHIYLLEYDRRFEVLAGKDHFFFYDYKEPDEIPESLRNKCDRILIDPPFLQERCQSLTAQCARNLLRNDEGQNNRIILSTGERMREVCLKLYPEIRITDFIPQHPGLSNEFRCYANFECSQWKFITEEP